jgi:O-antigen biosynthesis protein
MQHLLIIGSVWPEPNSSAAGSRMMQLMKLFQQNGWEITFASATADSNHMFDIESIGIRKVAIELNSESFDLFIKELNPNIVMFDRFMTEEQFGWRVAEVCPAAIRILDTEDLHCLRAARQKSFKEKKQFAFDDMMIDVAKREIASIYRCDLSLIISGVEMNLLTEHFKVDKSLLHHIPFMLEEINESTKSSWPSFEERNNFMTIGNFLHEPNWNSVQYLKEEIWPLIRSKLPKAELHIYGAYPSQKVNALHDPKNGFLIMGRADDARSVIQKAKVLLAPLRFGAGIKGKLTDAMQSGTPSVTTKIGAEAMHDNLPWNGIIADQPIEIAEAAVKLYQDKALWEKAQENGVVLINSIYQKEKLGRALIGRISEVAQSLEKHRTKNFIGAMLMHHTIAGTKYMSKWIEEKNKVN